MPFDAFGRARSQKYLVGSRLRAKRPKGEALARGAAPGKILVPHSRSTRLRRMIDNPAHVPSKAMLWTGRVISAIPVIFMTIGGLFFLFFAPDKVVEGMVKYGYPADAAKPILITEILCGLIYAIPQTATLGGVLMTAYLGGAVATHVHAGEPFFFPIIFGVLAWLGLLLRDARIRSLLPLRRI